MSIPENIELSLELTNFCKQYTSDSGEKSIITGIIGGKGIHLNFPIEKNQNVVDISGTYEPISNKFFKLLWNDHLNGMSYWFTENQYPTPDCYSGIMIDIDAYTVKSTSGIDNKSLRSIITESCRVLNDTLRFEKQITTYACIIRKPELKRIETVKDINNIALFKDGIHILLPGIKVKKEVKKYIILEIAKKINGEIKRDLDYKRTEIDPVDLACVNVCVQLYGSYRDKTTHKLTDIFEIKIDGTENGLSVETMPKENYVKVDPKTGKSRYAYNFCRELSLHYEGELIKKREFESKTELSIQTVTIDLPMQMFTESTDIPGESRINKAVNSLTFNNIYARELVTFLDLLNKKRGFRGASNGYNRDWEYVCECILTVDPSFIELAAYFSIQCDPINWKEKNGFDDLVKLQEKVKKTCIAGDESRNEAIRKIKSLACQDNPEKYKDVDAATLTSKINMALNVGTDEITSATIARVVATVYEGRFYYVKLNRAGVKNMGYWLIYVTEEMAEKETRFRPFVHKYFKSEDDPKELIRFIIENLSAELKIIHDRIIFREEQTAENEKGKFKVKKDRIAKTMKKIGEPSGYRNVITVLQDLYLLNSNITFELNNPKYRTLGVGNGILVFGKADYQFITDVSQYKITRATKTKYVPYNPANPAVIKLQGIIADIFPDKLERKCILMSLSEALVANSSQRYVHFWISNGSSGKTLIVKLLHNVLGMKDDARYCEGYGYSTTISPDVFMKEKNDPNAADAHLVNIEGMHVVAANENATGDIKSHILKRLRDNFTGRKLFGDSRTIQFPGIVIISSNGEPSFTRYDYGFERRILYYNFPTRFVYAKEFDPNKPQMRLRDDSIMPLAEFDPDFAEAFLSILLESWKELQSEYDGYLDKVMQESGVMDQTFEFIGRHDKLPLFVAKFVKDDPGNKIPITEVASLYATWLSKETGKTLRGDDLISNVQNSCLESKITKIGGIFYINDVKILDF